MYSVVSDAGISNESVYAIVPNASTSFGPAITIHSSAEFNPQIFRSVMLAAAPPFPAVTCNVSFLAVTPSPAVETLNLTNSWSFAPVATSPGIGLFEDNAKAIFPPTMFLLVSAVDPLSVVFTP